MTRERVKSTSTVEYFNPLLSETARTGRQKINWDTEGQNNTLNKQVVKRKLYTQTV